MVLFGVNGESNAKYLKGWGKPKQMGEALQAIVKFVDKNSIKVYFDDKKQTGFKDENDGKGPRSQRNQAARLLKNSGITASDIPAVLTALEEALTKSNKYDVATIKAELKSKGLTLKQLEALKGKKSDALLAALDFDKEAYYSQSYKNEQKLTGIKAELAKNDANLTKLKNQVEGLPKEIQKKANELIAKREEELKKAQGEKKTEELKDKQEKALKTATTFLASIKAGTVSNIPKNVNETVLTGLLKPDQKIISFTDAETKQTYVLLVEKKDGKWSIVADSDKIAENGRITLDGKKYGVEVKKDGSIGIERFDKLLWDGVNEHYPVDVLEAKAKELSPAKEDNCLSTLKINGQMLDKNSDGKITHDEFMAAGGTEKSWEYFNQGGDAITKADAKIRFTEDINNVTAGLSSVDKSAIIKAYITANGFVEVSLDKAQEVLAGKNAGDLVSKAGDNNNAAKAILTNILGGTYNVNTQISANQLIQYLATMAFLAQVGKDDEAFKDYKLEDKPSKDVLGDADKFAKWVSGEEVSDVEEDMDPTDLVKKLQQFQKNITGFKDEGKYGKALETATKLLSLLRKNKPSDLNQDWTVLYRNMALSLVQDKKEYLSLDKADAVNEFIAELKKALGSDKLFKEISTVKQAGRRIELVLFMAELMHSQGLKEENFQGLLSQNLEGVWGEGIWKNKAPVKVAMVKKVAEFLKKIEADANAIESFLTKNLPARVWLPQNWKDKKDKINPAGSVLEIKKLAEFMKEVKIDPEKIQKFIDQAISSEFWTSQAFADENGKGKKAVLAMLVAETKADLFIEKNDKDVLYSISGEIKLDRELDILAESWDVEAKFDENGRPMRADVMLKARLDAYANKTNALEVKSEDILKGNLNSKEAAGLYLFSELLDQKENKIKGKLNEKQQKAYDDNKKTAELTYKAVFKNGSEEKAKPVAKKVKVKKGTKKTSDKLSKKVKKAATSLKPAKEVEKGGLLRIKGDKLYVGTFSQPVAVKQNGKWKLKTFLITGAASAHKMTKDALENKINTYLSTKAASAEKPSKAKKKQLIFGFFTVKISCPLSCKFTLPNPDNIGREAWSACCRDFFAKPVITGMS